MDYQDEDEEFQAEDEEREQRITNEIIVDAYDSEEQALVVCQSLIDGYRCLSLMEASSAVKRQVIVTSARLRRAVQAATFCSAISKEGKRCDRHCRSNTESSISAILSQLACLGV